MPDTTPNTDATEEAPANTDRVDGTESDATEVTDPEGADKLGDAGKKALDTMKASLKAEKARRRDLEAKLAELSKPKPAEGDAPDLDAIRKEAQSEATKSANARVLKAEIKAAAAGKLADPKDAFKFLDLDDIEVDADGNVNSDEIAEAISDLLKSKPYLAAGKPSRFQGSADGGARNAANGPSQLSRADLAGMSPSEIREARQKGRLSSALGTAK